MHTPLAHGRRRALHTKLVPQQGVPRALPSPLLPTIKLLVAANNSRNRSGNGQKEPFHVPRTGLKRVRAPLGEARDPSSYRGATLD